MSENNLVYSTSTGRIEQPKESKPAQSKMFKDGFLRIERQTKGRKDKGVMLVHRFDIVLNDLQKLAQSLKSMMG